MADIDFLNTFTALTGNSPFPWQAALYERFVSDRNDNIPGSCNLPTGLGKTSVIAVWLIALANHAKKMPRRLVYVVNRRTVVDQTTDEVEKYRRRILGKELPGNEVLLALATRLRSMSATSELPLAISTLRGQFADNREWSADPSRPAVICGTVDMIGSRLLFSGYGCGFKTRPLHAGFLGQDALLVHDEAHLEPGFQSLIEAIRDEQKREPAPLGDWTRLKVMELTATSRGGASAFPNEEEQRLNEANPVVQSRVRAKKSVELHRVDDSKNLAEQISKLALKRDGAVLVFVRKVDDVEKIVKKLPKGAFEALTGTLRGLERDGLVKKPIFQRFLPESSRDATVKPAEGTVYLVCTSAGEVGVNISADHLVCDLSTFDSMAQRFGRVNRFGMCTDTRIDIVYPKEFEENELGIRLEQTLGLVELLGGDGSPGALAALREKAVKEGLGTPAMSTDRTAALRKFILANPAKDPIVAAFAPPPTILPATDFLFDAWALTTIKDKMPGRPMVEPYLHGVEDDNSFDTEFAWREEVALLTRVSDDKLSELLDDFPLKRHEVLRVPTFGKKRAYEQLAIIAEREPDLTAWVIEPNGELKVKKLKEIVTKRGTDYIVPLASRTVVLPPKAGGLTVNGALDGDAVYSDAISYDIAGTPPPKVPPLLRLKVMTSDGETSFRLTAPISGWPTDFSVTYQPEDDRWKKLNEYLVNEKLQPVKLALRLDLVTGSEDDDESVSVASEYLVIRAIPAKKANTAKPEWPSLENHLSGVSVSAEGICKCLGFPPELETAVVASAHWHDIGKGRSIWQRGAGNSPAHSPVAKTLDGRPPENLNHFRHELASAVDAQATEEHATNFQALADHCDLALHLVATHHGRGRPHFPTSEIFDLDRPQSLVNVVADAAPGRYAALQQKYGRWGLAYLESMLRAADAIESRRIETTPLADGVPGNWPDSAAKLVTLKPVPEQKHSIRVNVDPTNPGQFFACCGLLELADRSWPGAKGWFANGEFFIYCEGTLAKLLDSLVCCELTNTMSAEEHARFAKLTAMTTAERKSICAEDEYKALGALLRESPIVLKDPFKITLDWFTDDNAGGNRFKTWAGQQSVLNISKSMKDALDPTEWRNESCLAYSVRECGLPFNFDSDLGGQGGAIDVGFSFDPLAASSLTRIESSARPALEFLAFIGLQRFRPAEIKKGENRYLYVAWNRPLPIQVAMPAACSAMPVAGANRYAFRLLYRTKYLKSFLPAVPFTGDSDE